MFPRLETERLILRPFTDADLPVLAAYRSDPEIARYQSWDLPYTMAQARMMLARMRERPAGTPGTWHQVAAECRRTGVLIGDCAFCVCDEDPPLQAEIGYTVSTGYQGHGYATEATAALLSHLFDTLRLHRVFAKCDAENGASARVLLRLGMRQEAHHLENEWFKGRWSSELCFAMLDREWRDRSSQSGTFSK
jgi:RimJ/RimL family protein N-acetyltransferase